MIISYFYNKTGLFTVDILTCHSRKSAGKTNFINDCSVLLGIPANLHEQRFLITSVYPGALLAMTSLNICGEILFY